MRVFILFVVLLARINAQVFNDHKQINVPGCGLRPLAEIGANRNESRIVGGAKSIVGDWGWQVAIYRYKQFICGGSIINSKWVLTAAHCIEKYTNIFSYDVFRKHNR